MRKNMKLIIGMLVILAGCRQQGVLAGDNITIARDGQSHCVIVLGEKASAPVRHAADELAVFLNRITGGKFDIVNTASAEKANIYVGPEAAKMADAGFTTEGLGDEGIIIRTTAKGLILAGGQPRGTLYAVYSFLQDQIGCRWWSSTAETIPQQKTIELAPLNITYIPPIQYRETFWYDAFDADWAVRNKSNGNSTYLKEEHGSKHKYVGFVHTFCVLLPPDKYFAEHPEWYSLIDGERKKDAQLCLTNEQMRKELTENLKTALRKNPDATIASVSQNDGWAGNCQCPACKAVEEKEGSPSGLMLQFVNAVACDIEKEFPNVAIDTLAYCYTQKPPLHTHPRENVIVRLCNYKSSFCKPLTDPCNKEFYDDITNWSKMCSRIYIWDYVTNFAHYVQPHPNLRVLGPNIKFFAQNNVKGIFEQGAYQSYGAEMAELRAWVIAQMLWNPDLDGDKLIDEFVNGFYGPAAAHIKAYIALIHEAIAKTDDHLGCYSPPDAKFLSLATLLKGNEYLAAAEKSVENNPDYLKRVTLARLPLMYVFLVRWNELKAQAQAEKLTWPMTESIDEIFAQFEQTAKENKITRIAEPIEGLDKLRDEVKKQTEKPVAIIFDTDIGTDVDDAGAMAVLHRLATMGEAKILATISSNSNAVSPVAIDVINIWYGQGQIPVGTSRTGPGPENWYHEDVVNFPHRVLGPDDVPAAVDLYRKILAGQPDNSVKIVVVGWLTNMAELLDSKPDVHSRLSGKELVAAKVKELVTMGGTWPNSGTELEYNFHMDGPAACKVITEWPGKIMFTGLGRDVQTGKVLMEKATNENPVRAFYENFFIANNASERSSWDLIAVLYAVRGCGDYFAAVTDGYSTVDKAGCTTWITTEKTSNHSYLAYKMATEELAKILDELMLPGK